MAYPEGLEPPTPWSVAKYSIQLSYGYATLSCYTLPQIKEGVQVCGFRLHLAELVGVHGVYRAYLSFHLLFREIKGRIGYTETEHHSGKNGVTISLGQTPRRFFSLLRGPFGAFRGNITVIRVQLSEMAKRLFLYTSARKR